jgi:hypothetical protein
LPLPLSRPGQLLVGQGYVGLGPRLIKSHLLQDLYRWALRHLALRRQAGDQFENRGEQAELDLQACRRRRAKSAPSPDKAPEGPEEPLGCIVGAGDPRVSTARMICGKEVPTCWASSTTPHLGLAVGTDRTAPRHPRVPSLKDAAEHPLDRASSHTSI